MSSKATSRIFPSTYDDVVLKAAFDVKKNQAESRKTIFILIQYYNTLRLRNT